MKLITQWRFILLSALFSLLGVGSAWAQLRDGGVYYFESAYSETLGKSITLVDNQTYLNLVTTNTEDTKQLWEADEVSTGVFTLKNLSNNKYLWSSNNSAASDPAAYWKTVDAVDDYCKFSCTKDNGTYAMRATNTTDVNHYMHYSPGTTHIQCWAATAAASRWYIHEVVVYDEAAVPGALSNLFSDAACTTLKKQFANEAALTADIDYLKLPETLRNMVKKVYSQTWTENNYDGTKLAWGSDYAKKYRVQLYEPYNDIMNASEALTINWHTNLNNPTGIFANNGDVLYVMVEGEIEEGASLYLDYFVDGDRLSTDLNHGTPLQPGLNIITCTADKSNYCINYVVEVFDTTDGKRGHKAKKRALTEYSPLKIHIEGGYLNGYWNKMGDTLYPADKNDNWEYLEARANQKELLVLGQYVTLQFSLKDADTKGNKGLGSYLNDQVSVEDVIREWDNIMKWERMLLGLLHEDVSNAAAPKSPYSEHDHVIEYIGNDSDFPSGYGDYYNIHGLAWGVDHNTMYATGDYSAYHYATMDGVIKSIPTDAGSHWGPAHEMGHQHQNLINMRGEMEGSNNLFSNVVLWVHGELTSRVNGTEGSLEAVLKNFNNESGHYLSNSIWGISQMYYKLFLYYHVLGHNPKFYPRLFEMLRQDPQRDNNAGVVDGANAQLHLYKKVCEAAGEDLTEFFRAHGFFKPLNNAFVDDSYNVSVFNMSQKQIDAAIAEVKEQAKTKGWKVNTAVLFINDATGENILSHKDGVEHLTLNPETTICAQVGNYSNFNNTTANYSYSLSGTTVTMNGTGGVGFAVFNEQGEIMAFSNKKSFEISAAAASAIAAGKATIEIVKGDNTTHVATSIMDADNTVEKELVLVQTLNAAKAILDFTDNDNKKVGYYKTDKLTQLQTAYNQAKTIYDEKNTGAYAAVYELLYKEYTKVLADEYARVNIVDGYVYRLVNRAYNNLSMAVNNNDAMLGAETDEADNKQLWYLETASATNTYYLKNKATSKYPGNVESGEELSADKTTKSQAYAYRLEKIEDGVFAFVGGQGLHCSQSQGNKIVGWGADSKATQWYITAVETDATVEARLELEALAAKTKALIDEMAVATGIEEYDMSACTVTSNTPEAGQGTELLTDGNPGTFFHTNWQGTPTNEEHNLVFDLGENHNLKYFVINYTTLPTTAHNVDAPKTIVVEGSHDKSFYKNIATLSGLPETNATNYTSNALKGGYRYLRLKVTDATGNKLGDFYYFGLAELSFTQLCPIVKEVYTPYTALEADIISAAELCGRANFIVTKVETDINTINEAKTLLQSKYEALLEAYNTIRNGDVNAKKIQLAELITAAEELRGTCGTINSTPGVTIDAALQTENPAAGFYVSTNADQNTGGGEPDGLGIAALVDGSVEGVNYFHTRWSGTEIHEAHYIQIDLGEDVPTAGFTFSYTPRDPSPAPTAMKVYGSHDGIEFSNVLVHITSGLPAYNSGLTYTSETISSNYRYLRFEVTESQGPAASSQYGGQYYFGMYEFDLSYLTPTTYSATVYPNMGDVTEELLLNVFHKLAEAQGTLEFATTEAQLDKAIADLQAQYDALLTAYEKKNKVIDLSLLSNTVIYGINCKRGPIAYLEGKSTTRLSTPTHGAPNELNDSNPKENENEQFAILRTANTPEGKYYLYSLLKGAFVGNDANFLGTPAAVVEFKPATSIEGYDWEVWIAGQKLNVNQVNGVIMSGANTSDNGNNFRIEIVGENAEKTADAVAAIEAYEELLAVKEEAAALLNRVQGKVGYPDADACTTLQNAITAATNVDEVASAVLTFKESGNINLPEDGKAYKIYAWWRTQTWPMTYMKTTENGKFIGYAPAYAPVKDAQPTVFVCRELSPGIYTFVSNEGRYLGFQSDGLTDTQNSTGTTFVAGHNTCAVVKAAVNNKKSTPTEPTLTKEELFGTVNIRQNDANGYCYMFGSKSFKYHREYTNSLYYGETTGNAHTVYYTFEEVPDNTYTLNTIKMNALGDNDHQLLTGLETGMSMSTFSAPYPTVTPEGITAYYAEQFPEGNNTVATLKKMRTAIPANQGVVLVGEVGVSGTFKMLPAAGEVVPAAVELNNRLSATGAHSVVMSQSGVDYILGKGTKGAGFYKAKAGSTLAAGKAYFHFDNQAQVRNFVLRFGGETTNIEDAVLAPATDNDAIYDLSGRRVNEVTKGGIYIKNGKKFIVK